MPIAAALPAVQPGQADQRGRAGPGRVGRHRQGPLHPARSLDRVPAEEPEPPQAGGEPERGLGIVRARPAQRGAQVVVLAVEQLRLFDDHPGGPFGVVGDGEGQGSRRNARPTAEPVSPAWSRFSWPNCRTVSSCRYRVPAPVFSVTTSDLSTSLANRSSSSARCQRRVSADRLHRGEGETAGEHRQPAQQNLLRLGEQVVAPFQGATQRLVPGDAVRSRRRAWTGHRPAAGRSRPVRVRRSGPRPTPGPAACRRAVGTGRPPPARCRRRARNPAGPALPARRTAAPTAARPSSARSGARSAAGDGRANDGTRKVYSPWAWSGSRLVASTSTPGHPASRAATSWAQAASRCSQLSSTISSERRRSWSTSACPRLGAAPESNPSASDTASATSSDSPTAARSTNQTPSGYAGRTRPRGLQRQPGLAAAAGPGEGEQPGPAHQPLDVDELPLAPDEAGQRGWQVTDLDRLRRSLRRAGGRRPRPASRSTARGTAPPSGRPGRSRTRPAVRRPAAHSGPAPRIAGPCPASTTISARTAPSCSGIGFERPGEDDQRFLRSALPHAWTPASPGPRDGFPGARRGAPSTNRHPAGRAADRRVYRSAAARRLASSPVSSACRGRRLELQHVDSTGPASSSTTCSSRIASSPSLRGPEAGERAASHVQGLMQISAAATGSRSGHRRSSTCSR